MTLLFDISSITPTTGGGGANLTTLDVTPMTSAQSITPDEGYDGFSLVNVSAVNASIDANITASNIKQGVDILGVTGTMAPAALHSVSRNYSVVGTEAVPFNGDLTGAFNGLTSIAANAMNNAFGYTNVNTPVIFPDLTQIGNYGMNRAFASCPNIPSVDFPKLMSIANFGLMDTFTMCQNSLTIANFNSLTEINGRNALTGCFANCKNMVCASFPNLVSANGQGCFAGAFTYTNITELNFPKLENVGLYAFSGTGRFMNNLTNANFCNVVSVNDSSFSIFANNSSNFAGYANFSSLSSVSNSMVFSQAFRNTNVVSVLADRKSVV